MYIWFFYHIAGWHGRFGMGSKKAEWEETINGYQRII